MAVQQDRTMLLTIRLQWKITKFSELCLYGRVDSSEFDLGTNKFYLCVWKYNIHIYRFYIDTVNITSDFRIYWEFSFVDRHGEKLVTRRKSETFLENDEAGLFITELDLKQVGRELLVEDTLTVRCTLSMDGDSNILDTEASLFTGNAVEQGTQTENSSSLESESSKLLKTLSLNYEKLYEDKTDTDCILKAGDTQFPVHRTVLSARSSVFAAMFHHNTSESSSGEANILDVEAATLSDVLHYIYCGKIRGLTSDTAVSMFTVADKYAIIELRDSCLQFLLQNLSTGNICDAALLSHAHAEKILENKVISFIDDNLQQVLGSNKWNEFLSNKPLMAAKFLSAAYLASKTNKN